jgi:hypothetical protein
MVRNLQTRRKDASTEQPKNRATLQTRSEDIMSVNGTIF